MCLSWPKARKRSKDECPLCGKAYLKCIYMGMPLRVCADFNCACAEGIGCWFMEHIPPLSEAENERGWALFVYEGSYWKGLWQWMTHKS